MAGDEPAARDAVERGLLYLYAGLTVAVLAELITTLVTLSALGRGSGVPWEGYLPPLLAEVGAVGRVLWWTVAAVAALELAERTTTASITRTRAGRRRTAIALILATGVGLVAVFLALGWLLGLLG